MIRLDKINNYLCTNTNSLQILESKVEKPEREKLEHVVRRVSTVFLFLFSSLTVFSDTLLMDATFEKVC